MSVSRFNNWNAPLAGFGSPGDNFNGSPEATGAAACISVVILCSTQTTLKVEQNRSINNPFIFENEYTIEPGIQTTIQVRVVLPYFRVNIINDTMTTQTYMNMNTMLLAQLSKNVDIRRLEAGVDSITTNQMTTTATRPVYLLVIGSYYRVATVGNTSGAVWNAIGAIVGGESIPTIGRLFKCLSVPSNIEGQGTCYDVEYNDNTAITGTVDVGNFPASNQMTTTATRPVYLLDIGSYYRVATVGNTSGAVWNAIGAIVGGESIPTIGRLFKCLSVPSNIEGQGTCYDVEYNDNTAITGTVSLGAGTESVGTVRLNDAYGSPLVTTAGNLMVGINNIYTANPLHTIIDSGTVTFTEASSSVASLTTLNSSTQTIKASAGTLKSVFLTYDNSSGVTYVKLYDDASPTGTSTPLMVIPIVHGTSTQFDCHNLAFTTALTIRAVDSFGSGTGAPTGTVYATVLYM